MWFLSLVRGKSHIWAVFRNSRHLRVNFVSEIHSTVSTGSSSPFPSDNGENRTLSHKNRLKPTSTTSKLGSFSSIMAKNYAEAIEALNNLQSNAAVISKIKKERDSRRMDNIPTMIDACARVGISLDDLDKLKVIHVSGTKGKGSTCALCESILRQNGYKTGFYSSPHLIEVRERIRINGRPLLQDKFTEYFWKIYGNLKTSLQSIENNNTKMPAYFRFMTLMAFHVFLAEDVDVAIFEVGIGGEYDCTNVIRTPVVCGISSLGIDHVQVLGDTISKIAWQKAGILKKGCRGFTVPQPEDGLDVIASRAHERQSSLKLIPSYHDYSWKDSPAELGIRGPMQKLNASLALQLCNEFMKRHKLPIHERCAPVHYKEGFSTSDVATADTFTITEQTKLGLTNCTWPGRNQVIKNNNVTYYLDGAHTKRSMSQCIDWFVSATKEEEKITGKCTKLLVFNFTGDRQSEELMAPLVDLQFDAVSFCPNISLTSMETADLVNVKTPKDSQMDRCVSNKDLWHRFEEHSGVVIGSTEPYIFPCVSSALFWCTQGRDETIPSFQKEYLPAIPKALENAGHIQVLVTGSLHLIGCALNILDPDMNDRDAR